MQARGLYSRVTNHIQDAQVILSVAPDEDLSVSVEMEHPLESVEHGEDYLRAAVFGVLDVLLVEARPSVRHVRVTILDLVVHPTNSSVHAFRMAGRDAARKVLVEVPR